MSEFIEQEKKKKAGKTSPVSSAAHTVQRDLEEVNGPKGGMLPESVSAKIQSKRGSGRSLSDKQVQHYSEKFGRDMSDVHVHADAESDTISRSLNARAFTIGSDIFLSKGINPDGGGRDAETMTHELTHVVQQGGHAGFGRLKLGAADTAQEHEAEATAQREFSPQMEEEGDTIQRGFLGSLFGTIGHNLGHMMLNQFGMEDAYNEFMSGDKKVRAAIEKMKPRARMEYKQVEDRIKQIENTELKTKQAAVDSAQKAMNDAIAVSKDPTKRIPGAVDLATSSWNRARADLNDTEQELQTQLDDQVTKLKAVDETITKDDVNKYRSGKAKTFFASMFSSLGANFLSGFESDPDKKKALAGESVKSSNNWWASKNKMSSSVNEQTEEEKAKEVKEHEDALIADLWQSVMHDPKLHSFYNNNLLFKREVRREHSELIRESFKEGTSDNEIKDAVLSSLRSKAEKNAAKKAPANEAVPGAGASA